MATTYTISDLAKEFDLTTRAMRFYEDMGLLQPQREGAGGLTPTKYERYVPENGSRGKTCRRDLVRGIEHGG
jgi:hypothetical protein